MVRTTEMDVRGLFPMVAGGTASVPVAASASADVVKMDVPVAASSVQAQPVAVDSVDNSKMGIYLESQQDDGLPRWKVLTALRAYGLNLNQGRSVAVRDAVAAARRVVAEPKTVPVEKPSAVPASPAISEPAQPVRVEKV